MQEWTPRGLPPEVLHDGAAYHRALYPQGRVDLLASWHARSSAPLVAAAAATLHDGDLVVDYGAGAGGSAIELLKLLDRQGTSVDLLLVDPLPSWLSNAWNLLHERAGIHFRLSAITEGGSGKRGFLPLQELLGGRQADLILSSSMLHLVPSKARAGLLEQWRDCLLPTGRLLWNSGDIDHPARPADVALIHDPYRRVRQLVCDDPAYRAALSRLDPAAAERIEHEAQRIFPLPPAIAEVEEQLRAAGLQGAVTTQTVRVDYDDAARFILVDRLSRVAGGIAQQAERDALLLRHLSTALGELAAVGQADGVAYRSFWTYGTYTRGG